MQPKPEAMLFAMMVNIVEAVNDMRMMLIQAAITMQDENMLPEVAFDESMPFAQDDMTDLIQQIASGIVIVMETKEPVKESTNGLRR